MNRRQYLFIWVLLAAAVPVGYFAVGPAYPQVPAPKAQAPVVTEKSQLLQGVGVLAASHVYQTYLNIGFIADGRANGIYEDQDASQILESIGNLQNAADQQLEKIRKLDITEGERKSLQDLSKLSALVRLQADELRSFWKTGEAKHGKNYEVLRQQAWEGISRVLQLERKAP